MSKNSDFKVSESLDDAVMVGDIDEIERSVEQGFVLAQYSSGPEDKNALHLFLLYEVLAGPQEALDYIRYAVQSGVDINAQDTSLNTPLYYAVQNDAAPELVALLLELGADPDIVCYERYTPLRMAFRWMPFKWDLAELMLKAGADPDAHQKNQISVRDYVTGAARGNERDRLSMFDDY